MARLRHCVLPVLVAMLGMAGCDGAVTSEPAATSPVAAVMASSAAEGYARATTPGVVSLPHDHGPHPDFRTEWWYFTGNLVDDNGRAFGFQLTLFRFALGPEERRRASRFATRQVWMGHFAVTDVNSGRFHAFERFARGAAGLAGASARPFTVWLEDWRAASLSPEPGQTFPIRLVAAAEDVELDLVLSEGRQVVLQGDRGLSRKSPAAGNASYYYSYTRLPAQGRLSTPAGDFAVTGQAWMDREWSTSALAPDQSGWDWFALQLDDGRDLMFYQLRDANGDMHPFSAGVIVDAEGVRRRLGPGDVSLEPLASWSSPAGSRYPVTWRLVVGMLDLRVTARLHDQEHAGSFRYWEGAVTAEGRGAAGPVAGVGYLEMTGY